MYEPSSCNVRSTGGEDGCDCPELNAGRIVRRPARAAARPVAGSPTKGVDDSTSSLLACLPAPETTCAVNSPRYLAIRYPRGSLCANPPHGRDRNNDPYRSRNSANARRRDRPA
jgi:hypothetical protein